MMWQKRPLGWNHNVVGSQRAPQGCPSARVPPARLPQRRGHPKANGLRRIGWWRHVFIGYHGKAWSLTREDVVDAQPHVSLLTDGVGEQTQAAEIWIT